MFALSMLYRWLFVTICCAAMVGLPTTARAAVTSHVPPGQVKVMFIVQGAGQERSQTVENALAQAFLRQGYKVIDATVVAQTLRRNADLLRQPEVRQSDVEAAKRLGSGAGADIVVRGEAKSHVGEKTYTLLEGKKVPVSQADVSLRMVLARTGTLIMTDKATKRKPFDTSGEVALQFAAESIAERLLQGLEEFLNRDTVAYHFVMLNVEDSQSMAIQEGLRTRINGIRQVDEHRLMQNVLELDVSVAKEQDLPFKQSLPAQLSGLGLGRFEIAAREGKTIYVRKVNDPAPAQLKPILAPPRQPSDRSSIPPGAPELGTRQAPAGTPRVAPPPPPATGSTKYNPGYRKSWAVLIGINEYQQWPKLQYAVNDARSIENLLKGLGFNEVIMVLDREATQQHILRVLGDELYAKTQDDDRVFIFFAGHGQTQDLPTGEKVGYIIPVDGDLKNYYSTAISMRQLQDLGDRIRAKHMFYAMDACFSGLLLRMRGQALNNPPVDLTTAPARQVLTAGSEGEEVVESGGHGLFTKSLVGGLGGAADLDKDGAITAKELYQYITPKILQESRNSQNPVFGRLGHGQGEFVFMRK